MLQRLKGAIDRLAEEEEITQAAEQQRASRSTALSRRQNIKSSSRAQRPSQQGGNRKESSETGESISNGTPSPAIFEQDTTEQRGDGSEVANPSNISTELLDVEHPSEGYAADHGPDVGHANNESPKSSTTPQDPTPTPNPELPIEIRSKLRRLARLEGKYQELLLAYRQAHARNSTIEPFEIKLREITPLASIGDPQAFVEFINQLSLKDDMVLDELKKVSGEKDTLKTKLEDAERETRKAWDELARLRKEASTEHVDESGRERNLHTPKVGIDEGLVDAHQISPVANKSFSIAEMADMSRELQTRDDNIRELEAQVLSKNKELKSTIQSRDKIKEDFDDAEIRLKDLVTAKASFEAHLHEKYTKTEQSCRDLQEKLQKAHAELDNHKKFSHEHQADSHKLQSELLSAREELKLLKMSAALTQPLDMEVQNQLTEKGPETSALPVDSGINISAKKRKNNKKKKKASINASAASADKAVEFQEVISEASRKPQWDEEASDIRDLRDQVQERDVLITQLEKKIVDQEDLNEEIEGLRDELISVGQECVEAKDTLKQSRSERDALFVTIKELQDEIKQLRAEFMPDSSKISSEAASRIESLHYEKSTLIHTVKELEDQIRTLNMSVTEAQNLRAENERLALAKVDLEDEMMNLRREQRSQGSESETRRTALQNTIDELRIQIGSLETDLSASQQLATSRYRDLAEIRERIQRLQPEVISLRSEVSELRSFRDDQAAKISEIRKQEARQADLRLETSALRKEIVEREAEIKSLQQKIAEESTQRETIEESYKKVQRLLQRSQREKSESISAKEEINKLLQEVQADLEHYKTFEAQVLQLNRDLEGMRDDVALKSAQYASAQSLMNSLQDQTTEMATQNRETKERCESLEDELTEVCRQRDGRSREAETMRRLLAEVEGRAESRINAMKDRLENANEERDRAEDEARTIGRRRAKELDEVKSQLRDTEKELKQALESKIELDQLKKELLEGSMSKAQRLSEVAQELTETKDTVKILQGILQDGESQIKKLEAENIGLKRDLEEVRIRLEKQQKSNKSLTEDLRSLRSTRLRSSDSPAQSSRSSLDNGPQGFRIMSPSIGDKSMQRPSLGASSAVAGSGAVVDQVYLKQILLQFVEQKDRKLQLQLVPVLGMLLNFDKRDEQRWSAAVSAK